VFIYEKDTKQLGNKISLNYKFSFAKTG